MANVRRIIVAVFLAAAALGLVPAAAHALTNQEKLDLTRERLERARTKIGEAKQQKASLSDQIAGIDQRLTSIDDELARLGDRIAVLEVKLSTTKEKLSLLREQLRRKRAQLARAEEKLELQQEYFAERMVATYKTDELSYVDVVLASASFEDLISSVRVVGDIIGGDNELVGELEATRNEINEEKQTIAAKEDAVHKAAAALQEETDELAALRASEAAEKQEALAARSEKDGALAAVSADLKELARQEDALLAQSRALSGIITGASGGGSGKGTGSMMWPCGGSVTSPYGWRMHPILHVRRLHTGIDIGVGYGTAIHAADSGTVIYATWMSGYGNVIIIDHGKGISTLYAHQSSLAVGNGASVSRGQVIGYVGSTGYSTGPHLHFEVRVNGNTVDPMGYLP